MRKTLILGTLVALFGLAGAVQASDHPRSGVQDETQVTRAASNESRADRHDRYERHNRSRERHDEYREQRHDSREGHDESKEREHRR